MKKKFSIWLAAFIIAVVIVDVGFGIGCRYLMSHAKGGFTRSHEYVAHQCNEDVLIFGSSRAIHHYVPSIITDSLGWTCYNCGMGGNGILYLYSRFLMVTNRYTPKMIIYDVESSFDLSEDDHTKYLGWQKRYCDILGVMDVIVDIQPQEKWKLKSNLYRYNGSFIQMLTDNIHTVQQVDATGYQPIYSVMDYDPNVKIDKEPIHWDAMKKKYFDKMVDACRQKGIVLIFAYSPSYGKTSSIVYSEMTDYCKANSIPLLDYYASPRFVNEKKWFGDSNHMNDDGARVYTKEIVCSLRKTIK